VKRKNFILIRQNTVCPVQNGRQKYYFLDSNGHEEYWLDGNLHRIDGPAVKWPNGDTEYWVDGKLIKVVKSEKEIQH
jgi:hypothetical protein